MDKANSKVKKAVFLIIFIQLTVILTGCGTKIVEPEIVTEYYYPMYRQSPPEPVYSRLTWVHTPGQIRPKVKNESPLIMPQVSFELPRTNTIEAYESVAQTIGYKLALGSGVNSKSLQIKVVGGVDEVLNEIDSKSGCNSSLDHKRRVLSVVGFSLGDEVPQAVLPTIE